MVKNIRGVSLALIGWFLAQRCQVNNSIKTECSLALYSKTFRHRINKLEETPMHIWYSPFFFFPIR